MRTFVAIPVVPTGQMMKILSELGLWRKQGSKPVAPENMHLTLKFLGEIDGGQISVITDALEEAARDHGPFRILYRGMGAFPNENHIKVVWIGIVSDELESLANDVIGSLSGAGFERSRFSPHLTMARVKGPKSRERIQDLLRDNRERDFGRQDVDAIFLMKSTLTPSGPIYDELARIGLDRPGITPPEAVR